MKRGKFIVFEGVDGCGKNTQIDLLKPYLPDNTVYTREPGGTKIGEDIRSILMAHSSVGMTVDTEMFLFYASRAQFLKEVVEPALNEGKIVISSRFSPSTVAYQIYRKEENKLLPFLKSLEARVVGEGNKPDMCLIFDLPVSLSLQRINKRRGEEKTRFDVEPVESHERVRQGYINAMRDLGYRNAIIDASPSPEEVHKKVIEVLEDIIPLKKPL